MSILKPRITSYSLFSLWLMSVAICFVLSGTPMFFHQHQCRWHQQYSHNNTKPYPYRIEWSSFALRVFWNKEINMQRLTGFRGKYLSELVSVYIIEVSARRGSSVIIQQYSRYSCSRRTPRWWKLTTKQKGLRRTNQKREFPYWYDFSDNKWPRKLYLVFFVELVLSLFLPEKISPPASFSRHICTRHWQLPSLRHITPSMSFRHLRISCWLTNCPSTNRWLVLENRLQNRIK